MLQGGMIAICAFIVLEQLDSTLEEKASCSREAYKQHLYHLAKYDLASCVCV